MSDPYSDREQTRAKHFILGRYLQALAFKVLTFSDVTYVDGFSGPWETKTENFSDSSFMIAISVLQDAQKRILARMGKRRLVRCFFSENDPTSFAQLEEAVSIFHKPEEGFEIRTHCGKFEDAVKEIHEFIGPSFPLVFIDPTGWTGYPFKKIKPLFRRQKCEVLINFMYEFVLGGPGWRERLDPNLPRGLAVEKLFRETLKSEGNFDFVVSTRIDKATAERPHFFIVYGTKSPDGLKAFRQTEYDALRQHAKNRASVKERSREERSHTVDLFSSYQAEVQEATIGQIVDEQKKLASDHLVKALGVSGPLSFSTVVIALLQAYMLRETNIRDICVDLAKTSKIENSWGGGKRKPHDVDIIKLETNAS